jgi:hypothetical protein
MFSVRFFRQSFKANPLLLSFLAHFIAFSFLVFRLPSNSKVISTNRQDFVLLDNVSTKTNIRSRVSDNSAESKGAFIMAKRPNNSVKPSVIDARKSGEKTAKSETGLKSRNEVKEQFAKPKVESKSLANSKPDKVNAKAEDQVAKATSQSKQDKVSISPPPPTARNVGTPKPDSLGAISAADGDLFNLGSFSPDDPESIAEFDYLKSSIERHRNFAGLCAKGVDQVEVIFEISLNPDGSINFIEYIGDNAGGLISERTRAALIDQNLRAIEFAAPFKGLKLARYHFWKKVRLKFTQH